MKLLILPIVFLLSGCLSLNGIATSGAATTGAVVGTTLISPVAGAVIGAGAGITTDVLLPDPHIPASPTDHGGENGQIDSLWELGSFAIANFFNHLVTIGVGIGIFWLLSIYIGARMPRREEKAAEKQVKMLVDKIGTMKEK